MFINPCIRRRKLSALLLTIPVIALTTLAAGVQTASAWHADISGHADCHGTVTFVANSWTTGDKGANNKVGVYYSTDGGADYTPITPDTGDKIVSKSGVAYEFTKANGYSFADSFVLPNFNAAVKVTLMTKSLGTWGDGTVKVSERTTVIDVPAPCNVSTTTSTVVPTAHQPSVSVSGPACNADAHVVLKNDGDTAIEFVFYKDSDTKAFEKHEVAAKSTQNVKVHVDHNFKLSVRAWNMTKADYNMAAPADCSNPSAKVSQVCQAVGSGWNADLNNDGKVDEVFTVKVAEKVVDTVKIAAGQKTHKSYKFADMNVDTRKSVAVVIVVDEKIIQTSNITNDCVGATAAITTECNTPAGNGAVLTFTNNGKVDEVFTVTRDNQAVAGSPLTVAAGVTTQKLLAMDQGTSAHIAITTADGLKVEKDVTLTCAQPAAVSGNPPPAEVLGTTTAKAALATTGIDVMPMSSLGGMLIFLGLATLRCRKAPGVHYR